MYRPLLLAAWYSSAEMDRILSVFIGGSLVWDFSGACLIAFHRCIKKIVVGWTVKTRKNGKSLFRTQKAPCRNGQRAQKSPESNGTGHLKILFIGYLSRFPL